MRGDCPICGKSRKKVDLHIRAVHSPEQIGLGEFPESKRQRA